MDLDLGAALHHAARSGTASLPDLRPTPVMRRIRRRRMVQVVTTSTVGVAAAGGVAFGATQLVDGPGLRPVPPASESQVPDPADEPARHVVTPDAALGCGLALPGITDPPGTEDLRLEPALGATTLTAGDPLTLDATLVNGDVRDLDASTSADGIGVWLAQGGTVVGTWTSASGPAAGSARTGTTGDRWSQPLQGLPVACPVGAAAPTALPPGSYDLYVSQTLHLTGGGTLDVAGGPLLLVVVAPAQEPRDMPPAAPPAREPDLRPGAPAGGRPAAEDLVVSPTGLGPLAVGRPPATNPGAAMIEWDPDHCADLSAEAPGRWVAAGYPPEVRDGEPRPLFHVAGDDSAVTRIDVLTPSLRTAEGVGVGTTLVDLQATYPDLAGPFDGPVSRVWWLTGSTGTLVLETQGPSDGLQPEGTPESVVLMRVLAAGLDPAFAAANSDDVAGGC